MTKPIIEETRWAVTLGGVESTNVTAPDGTLKDDGYENDAIPEGFEWNYWRRKAYAWFQYLNAQVFEGAASVLGSFVVGGQSFSFTSHTFTASSATHELTITAHGLVTGDGVLSTSNSGGALPSPLAASTAYFAVVTGANTFRLARTRAEALSGFYIKLTTNGSGTNSIGGVSPTHVAPATVVGDLDATRLVPLVTASWPAQAMAWVEMTNIGTRDSAGLGSARWQITGGTDAKFVYPVALPVGTVLTKVRLFYDLNAAGNSLTFAIGQIAFDGSISTIEENLTVDNTSTVLTTQDITLFGVTSAGNFNGSAGSYVIQSNHTYWLIATFHRVGGTITFEGGVINPLV